MEELSAQKLWLSLSSLPSHPKNYNQELDQIVPFFFLMTSNGERKYFIGLLGLKWLFIFPSSSLLLIFFFHLDADVDVRHRLWPMEPQYPQWWGRAVNSVRLLKHSLLQQCNFTISLLACDPWVPQSRDELNLMLGSQRGREATAPQLQSWNGPWWETYTFGVITALKGLEIEMRPNSRVRPLLQAGELESCQG